MTEDTDEDGKLIAPRRYKVTIEFTDTYGRWEGWGCPTEGFKEPVEYDDCELHDLKVEEVNNK